MGYDALFELIRIGEVKIKNRIAMAPMNMICSNPGGYNSELFILITG
ncbi:MAG: hypothetical protein ABSB79_08500 [Syntrophales bacterium]